MTRCTTTIQKYKNNNAFKPFNSVSFKQKIEYHMDDQYDRVAI